MKCESCGKNKAYYWVDSYINTQPPHRECCVCVDRRVTKVGPEIKRILNIREIETDKKEGI